jgi:pimeloyl-ACP methyl ester carboxylesterase
VRIWLWAKRALLGLFGVIVTTGAAGAAWQAWATRRDLAATPAPGRLVDVGGHRLHIWCLGNQSPTVILEGGLGGSTAAWGFVQPEVAAFTRVCAYDRAGLGYSDPGPLPRTARRIAAELDRLLGAAGVEDPVVIAGASIGGLFARFVASQHEARVAGLVLVDASHEDQPVEIPQATCNATRSACPVAAARWWPSCRVTQCPSASRRWSSPPSGPSWTRSAAAAAPGPAGDADAPVTAPTGLPAVHGL